MSDFSVDTHTRRILCNVPHPPLPPLPLASPSSSSRHAHHPRPSSAGAARSSDGGSGSRSKLASRPPGDEVYVGKYKLLKTIGKGNFAKVKLARHMPTGQEVRGRRGVGSGVGGRKGERGGGEGPALFAWLYTVHVHRHGGGWRENGGDHLQVECLLFNKNARLCVLGVSMNRVNRGGYEGLIE